MWWPNAESDLWQAAVSSDGRRAHVVYLIYCTASNLLQAMETEEQGRRTGRWNREEGMKVANLLGEKSLIKASSSSSFEGRAKLKVSNVLMEKKHTLLHFWENLKNSVVSHKICTMCCYIILFHSFKLCKTVWEFCLAMFTHSTQPYTQNTGTI